jgi:hypothetical protein
MNIKLFEPSDLTKCHTVVATNRLNYALPMYPNGTMESSNKIPFDLTTCHTNVEINRLKIALPMYPNGTMESSKNTPMEVIGLMEWSLPYERRTKFDIDYNILSMNSKAKLIEACKAKERNKVTNEKHAKPSKNHIKQKAKFDNSNISVQSSDKKTHKKSVSFYCTDYGKNPTHLTSDGFIFKNHKINGSFKMDTKHRLSSKTFRQELLMLAKKTSNKKVIVLNKTAITCEHAKRVKQYVTHKVRKHERCSRNISVHSTYRTRTLICVKHGSTEKDTKRTLKFRKEINNPVKKTSKEKALDLYAIAIKREQAKPFKTSSKRKACDSKSNSASDMSVHAMNPKTSIF